MKLSFIVLKLIHSFSKTIWPNEIRGLDLFLSGNAQIATTEFIGNDEYKVESVVYFADFTIYFCKQQTGQRIAAVLFLIMDVILIFLLN